MEKTPLTCIKDIQHAFYINLEHRKDRKQHVEFQLSSIGIEAQRFNAIKMDNGAIGCSMSHLKILQHAITNKLPHILIVEDDITFLDPILFTTQLNTFLSLHTNDWDVVLLAGNNVPPYTPVDNTCIQVKRCQTTTGYLVNGPFIKPLFDNIKEGLQLLFQNPSQRIHYAIDRFWFKLQEKHRWFLIIPPTVIQKTGYSDIEKRVTNYSHLMTDINKAYLFKK